MKEQKQKTENSVTILPAEPGFTHQRQSEREQDVFLSLVSPIEEGGAASKNLHLKIGYFLFISQQSVSADITKNSAVGTLCCAAHVCTLFSSTVNP